MTNDDVDATFSSQESTLASNIKSPLFYPRNYPELSSKHICQSLKTFLIDFGNKQKTLSKYNSCDKKFDLFKPVKSKCLTDVSEAFCEVDVIYLEEKEQFFDRQLTEYIMQTINGCLHKSNNEDESYKCPSLDPLSRLISDPYQFCVNSQKSETLPKLSSSPPDPLIIDQQTYEFVSIEDRETCARVIELYNFCIKFSRLNNLSSEMLDQCHSLNFGPYVGSNVMVYNQINQQKCQQFVLPFFLHKEATLNENEEYLDFCEEAYHNIKRSIQARILTESALKEENFKQAQVLAGNSEILQQLLAIQSRAVQQIITGKNQFARCYSDLKAYIEFHEEGTLELMKYIEHLQEANDANLNAALIIKSYATSQVFLQSQVEANYESIVSYIDKIETAISTIDGLCEATENLIATSTTAVNSKLQTTDEEQSKTSNIDGVSKSIQPTIVVGELNLQSDVNLVNRDEDLVPIEVIPKMYDLSAKDLEFPFNQYMQSKSIFEQFLTNLNTKIQMQQQQYRNKQISLQQQIEDNDSQILALQEQHQLSHMFVN